MTSYKKKRAPQGKTPKCCGRSNNNNKKRSKLKGMSHSELDWDIPWNLQRMSAYILDSILITANKMKFELNDNVLFPKITYTINNKLGKNYEK